MYDIKEKKHNFTLKLTLEDAKKLLLYFDDEFMESFDEFLETLEEEKSDNNEDLEYYDELRNIIEDVVDNLHKEIRKKERLSKIDEDKENLECRNIIDKLNPYSKEILKKILEVGKKINKISLYRLYWYLHNSYHKEGEIIFTENSLENLLELDRYKLEKFLIQLLKIQINFGEIRGKIITEYKILNSTTIKIIYDPYMVNPYIKVSKEKKSELDEFKKITANII